MDVTKISPAPWKAVHRYCNAGPDDDEVFGLAWDIEGPPEAINGQFAKAADAQFVALARNALDIMMRRSWWPQRVFQPGWDFGWVACYRKPDQPHCGPWIVMPSIDDCRGHPEWRRYWPDPFTCIVETDKWLTNLSVEADLGEWLRGREADEANARLIAAAPDLLAALERFVLTGVYQDYEDRLLALAAIGKAKGQ